jgi:hypothetical protein
VVASSCVLCVRVLCVRVLCVRVLCVHSLGQPTLVTKQALLESRHAFDELVSKAEAASPVRRGPTVSTVGTPGPQHRQGGEEHVPMAQLVTFLTPPAASAPHKSKGAAMGPGAKVWPGSRGGRGAGEEEEEEEVDPRVRWVTVGVKQWRTDSGSLCVLQGPSPGPCLHRWRHIHHVLWITTDSPVHASKLCTRTHEVLLLLRVAWGRWAGMPPSTRT